MQQVLGGASPEETTRLMRGLRHLLTEAPPHWDRLRKLGLSILEVLWRPPSKIPAPEGRSWEAGEGLFITVVIGQEVN